jgi:(p)ppGpp synthase/HD superfamily hydrolase
MQKYKTLADAVALAEFAHRNQVDKAGLPYIDHPRRVLEKVKAQGALPYVQMAAILHDVTEDTAFTPEMLLALGIPESAVEIIRLLDRNMAADEYIAINNDYADKNEFYYAMIRRNPWAKMVKLADIEDNLSPWRLIYLSEPTQARLQEKYAKARRILEPGVWTNPYHPHIQPC